MSGYLRFICGAALLSLFSTGCSPRPEPSTTDENRRQPSAFSLEGFPEELETIRAESRRRGPPTLGAFQTPLARPALLAGVTKPDLLATYSETATQISQLNPASAEQMLRSRFRHFRAGGFRELRDESNLQYTIHDYAKEVAAELGTFPSFSVFDKGVVIPITLNNLEISSGQHTDSTECDRPALLGLGTDGQCVPYSRIGRLQGINPSTGLADSNIQWIFIARRYNIKTDPNDPLFEDVAIIGHNKSTGFTAFFQMLDPVNGKNATRVPSPFESTEQTPSGALTAEDFWLPPARTAAIGCNRCHDSDPFIHTPYVDQVRVGSGGASGPIVPSNTRGRYRFLGSKAFTAWAVPQHFDPEDNFCVGCHRIGTSASSESFAKWATGEEFPLQLSTAYRTYPYSHWMPPEDAESMSSEDWNTLYRQSVLQLLSCYENPAQAACRVKPIP